MKRLLDGAMGSGFVQGFCLLTLATLLSACAVSREIASPSWSPNPAYEWRLPQGFPVPRVPADNPMSAAKVELGRHLFYDKRLSLDGTASCATCHRQEFAFTDGEARAVGVTGELHPRGAMSLANVAYSVTLGWDDPHLERLEEQARIPMFNTEPVELGLAGREARLMTELRQDPRYQDLFDSAFPAINGIMELPHVLDGLAAFQRTLISGDTPFDRWLAGNEEALSPEARQGSQLFFSQRVGCFRCHRGFNLSGPADFEGAKDTEKVFLNTGLYDEDGRGAYPASNTGLHRFTGNAEDMGRFRIPTLRNVALTAPYMHDGSVGTLSEVVDIYAAGGRTDSPFKSPNVKPFQLSENEKEALLRFLESLTDLTFIRDPHFADPWQ